MGTNTPVNYELWQEPSGFSFFPTQNDSARRMLDADSVLVWSCAANSWEEALRLRDSYLSQRTHDQSHNHE
jgi:hypothetical protein